MAKETKVTRIKANDATPAAPKKAAATAKSTQTRVKKTNTPAKTPNGFIRPFVAIGGYFKGAWEELRQVRWPSRRATWVLTFAVILFSIFFTIFIVLLDILFKYLFELIIT